MGNTCKEFGGETPDYEIVSSRRRELTGVLKDEGKYDFKRIVRIK